MSARRDDDQEAALVPGGSVVGRVWLGGLSWRPLGGTLLTLLGGEPLYFAVIVGAPAGLIVGAIVSPVAAVVLLSRRPHANVRPSVATAVTLGSFLLLAFLVSTWNDGDIGVTLRLVGLICAIAAGPMYLTLRRARRPVGEPA